MESTAKNHLKSGSSLSLSSGSHIHCSSPFPWLPHPGHPHSREEDLPQCQFLKELGAGLTENCWGLCPWGFLQKKSLKFGFPSEMQLFKQILFKKLHPQQGFQSRHLNKELGMSSSRSAHSESHRDRGSASPWTWAPKSPGRGSVRNRGWKVRLRKPPAALGSLRRVNNCEYCDSQRCSHCQSPRTPSRALPFTLNSWSAN